MVSKYRPKTKPFKHQVRGLKKLWQDGGGALFWEPGTGKTKTALDFCAALYHHKKARRVLVLAPINALTVWPKQSGLHLGVPYQIHVPEGIIREKEQYIYDLIGQTYGSRGEMHIVCLNYDAIINRDKQWRIMRILEAFSADVLVLDESHYVKNPTTKRAKAAHRLGLQAPHVVLMTGTPIGNNYLDLYSQMKVIDPAIWKAEWTRTGNMSWTDFKYHYAKWGGRTGYELRGYQNLDDLRRRYKPFVSTARKRDCLDLPPTTDVEIPVEMPPRAFKSFQIFGDEGIVVHRGHLIEAPIPLTKLLRMRQMSGGWVQDEHGELVEWHTAKLEVFKDWLKDMKDAERKVLVFADFVPEMEAIQDAAQTDLLIRGGVSARRRESMVDSFTSRSGHQCMVLHAGSAEALDGLQVSCSDAAFFSKNHSHIKYQQARGRLDRSGQSEPVTFYHFTCGIDSLVDRALREKKNLEKMVLDDPDLLVVDRV